MTVLLNARLNAVRHFTDVTDQRPTEWCVQNARFDEAGNRGPFVTAGREYIIEPLNDFADKSVHDVVLPWGSQSGKSAMLMAGAAWCSQNDPCNFMWAMPSINLAQRFSRKRWLPMLRASAGTRDSLPRGADRFDVKTLEQRVGAAAFTFTGSNSPAGLSSEPCRRVIADEVDKFDQGGDEANAVDLLDQRTKGQANPQRWKTSTPTLDTGLIWQAALKGDFRRYYVPCPLCGRSHPTSRRMVFAWSPQYTVLGKENAAFVVWDKEAQRADGEWDLDRVARSARFECPHCKGHILDGHKTWMNREGAWTPTRTAQRGFVSRHLPSLYACSPETSLGALAVKFLQAKKSLLGVQGFINGDLAEPYQSQDRQRERVELVSSKIEIGAEWHLQLTVDCQAKSPNFWYVKRAFEKSSSLGLVAGGCDTWDDLRRIQNAPGEEVQDACVCVDSGFGAKSDAEVYRRCAEFGIIKPRRDSLPIHMGWMPAKGMPGNKRWKNEKGLFEPFYLRGIDPYIGTADAGQIEMSLFEFASEFIKDILENLRKGEGGQKWSVRSEVATEEYWKHLDAKIKVPVFNRMTGQTKHQWTKRSQHWPDHLDDCEIMQIALAGFFGLFDFTEKDKE